MVRTHNPAEVTSFSRLIAFSRLVLSASGVVAFFALALPAFAQAPPATVPSLPPPDVQKVMGEIADLDLLKVLQPLKLTKDQREKLLVPLREAVKVGAARRKEDYDGLRALGAEIAKARTEAINGASIPADLEAKVTKTVIASDERANAARKQAVASIGAVANDILTSEQKDAMEKLVGKALGGKRLVPAKYRANPNSAPKAEVQALALAFYVEQVLLNERAVDLLTQMKDTAPATETAPSAPPTTAP